MPPVNDNFASRILLTGNTFNVSGTNTGATVETGEMALYNSIYQAGANSVWYEYVPTMDGFLSLDTLQSTGITDTIIWVFNGDSIGTLELVAYNDDENRDPFNSLSLAIFPVVAGRSYKISITGYGDSNEGSFVLNGGMFPAAINDSFTQAQSITISSFPIALDTTFASNEVGEPVTHYTSLWYKFTSPDNGVLTLHATSEWISAAFAVYTGNNLTELTPVNPIAGSLNPVTIPILANLAYRIVVYSQTSNVNNTEFGPATVDGSFVKYDSVTNGNFSSAMVLTGNVFNISTNNFFANPIWYSYTPTDSGILTLSQTSGIALNFKFYVGTDLQTAVKVADSNDSISVLIQENITYLIAISNQNSTTYGTYTFSGSFANELPFKYTSVNSNIQNSGQEEQAIVIESGGRIWAISGSPSTAIYSDDKGLTWTADTGSQIDTSFAFRCLFLDENENLVAFKLFDSGSTSIVRAYVRNKIAGTWATYDASSSFVGAGSDLFSSCQDDSMMIHIVKSVIDSRISSGITYTYGNIFYCNFKDGVFSSTERLTFYSSDINIPYSDGLYYDRTSDWKFLKIIFHNNQLLIFWPSSHSLDIEQVAIGVWIWNNSLNLLQYAIKGSNMDFIRAAHVWQTGIKYYVDFAVSHNGLYYKCLADHTAGTFATDLANGDWVQVSSFTTPTILNQYQSQGPVIGGVYGPAITEQYIIPTIRSNGNLYYMFFKHTEDRNGNETTSLKLFKNLLDITPPSPSWADWLESDYPFTPVLVHLEVSNNDDLMLFGFDSRSAHGAVIARISGEWRTEHIDSKAALIAGHTYNFAEFK